MTAATGGAWATAAGAQGAADGMVGSGCDFSKSIKDKLIGMCRYNTRVSQGFIKYMNLAIHGEACPRDVKSLIAKGAVTWNDGGGAPKPTVLGRSLMMSAQLGITFLDACVLAVTYRYARGLSEITECKMRTVVMPLRTIQNYLVDWPCGDPMICKSVSRLRNAGLLPRSMNGRVACDMRRLAGIHEELVGLDGWVERVSNEMRMMLIAERTGAANP
ncbi:MAG: hypothetical protein J4F28_08170 [Nitrosopumilaceae archaeon]|nr:hypothetical protein [Nitrosopumilaceae archaeon]